MSEEKSQKIQFYANELRLADRDIDLVKKINDLPMASLKMYNGSGKEHELLIWQPLREPLRDFLLSHFEEKKQEIFVKMKQEILKL